MSERRAVLCGDRVSRSFAVIKLKNVKATQNTFGQISTCVGWVQDNIAGKNDVIGLVISRGFDVRFQSALKMTDRIFQIDLNEIGFR